jgi:hypothetical protein
VDIANPSRRGHRQDTRQPSLERSDLRSKGRLPDAPFPPSEIDQDVIRNQIKVFLGKKYLFSFLGQAWKLHPSRCRLRGSYTTVEC